MIAHRMRTVEAADKIIVLADGRVAEEGTPAELMNKTVFTTVWWIYNDKAPGGD